MCAGIINLFANQHLFKTTFTGIQDGLGNNDLRMGMDIIVAAGFGWFHGSG